MLLFSTLLDIKDSMKKDDFLPLVFEWNRTSSKAVNVIPGLAWNGSNNGYYSTENLSLESIEYQAENIIAVRFRKKAEGGVVWDSDYIMNFNRKQMSIQLSRSYLEAALKVDPAFSTPHFITLLEEAGYLEADGDLPVTRAPIYINGDDQGLLLRLAKGEAGYRLPVVYVSKLTGGTDPIPDIRKFASRLKGVAHVLVQENVKSNRPLRGSGVETNGAVGVYYPNPALGHKTFRRTENLAERIITAIIGYSNSLSLDPLWTWSGVTSALLREKISELSASWQRERENAREANDLVDSTDEEIRALRDRIDDLSHETEALRAENAGLRRKLGDGSDELLLRTGKEKEFYEGEIRDLVLSSLNKAVSQAPMTRSRRTDVLSDIIKANGFEDISASRSREVKTLLRGYSGMTASLRQALEEMGFEITGDGKHYKITYHGDSRYQTVFAKTPSDVRSGDNNAAALISMAF